MGPLLGLSAASNAINTGLNAAANIGTTAFAQNNQRIQNLKYMEQAPQAYVSGLQQAGLNPMLAYSSPSSPMSSSSASNGSTSTPSSGNTGKQMMSLIKFLKEIKNIVK